MYGFIAKTLSKASLFTVPDITKDIVVFLVVSCSLSSPLRSRMSTLPNQMRK